MTNDPYRQRGDRLHADHHPASDQQRLVGSAAWRRLSDITQVDAGNEDSGEEVRRTRMTHSLEVAQLGRTLAQRLLSERPDAVIDPDVVFVAGMAHDLGHPPFGHVGERALNTMSRSVGGEGFEGNAQTLRAVARHDGGLISGAGLNLTRATLAACMKYPWLGGHENREKYSVYPEDRELLDFAIQASWPGGPEQGRPGDEARIMDCADDITYAVHDLTDYVRSGSLSLTTLISGGAQDLLGQLGRSLSSERDLIPAAERLIEGHLQPMAHAALQEAPWKLESLAHDLRAELSAQVQWRHDPDSGRDVPAFDEPTRQALELLKAMIWQYVINAPGTGVRQHGSRAIITTLFETYHRATRSNAERRIFPPELLSAYDRCAGRHGPRYEQARARLACDAVARLSERRARTLAGQFRGLL